MNILYHIKCAKWIKRIVIGLLLCSSFLCFAAEASAKVEKIYLTQLVNQLDAMKPLIIAASKQQPKTNRLFFHYIGYRDAKHTWHTGLLDEINQIQKVIQLKLDHAPAEPTMLSSIQADYITHPKSTNQW